MRRSNSSGRARQQRVHGRVEAERRRRTSERRAPGRRVTMMTPAMRSGGGVVQRGVEIGEQVGAGSRRFAGVAANCTHLTVEVGDLAELGLEIGLDGGRLRSGRLASRWLGLSSITTMATLARLSRSSSRSVGLSRRRSARRARRSRSNGTARAGARTAGDERERDRERAATADRLGQHRSKIDRPVHVARLTGQAVRAGPARAPDPLL